MTQGGFGVSLKLNGTAVVNVERVDELSFMKYMAESTGHDSPGGYYEAVPTGKRRIEPFTCGLFWDKAEATHAAVIAAFNSDNASTLTWSDPDGDETITFLAHIERLGRISEQEAAYRASVAFHPTGTATIV